MGNGLIRTAAIDFARSYTAKPNTALAAPSITASSTAAGYSATSALIWNRAKWRSGVGTSHSITLDFSASPWSTNSYNAVLLWFNNSVDDVFLGNTPITSITLQTSSTGAFAGEEVTESVINSFTGPGYVNVLASRIKSLKTLASRSVSGVPYVRVIWACSSSQIELAKIAVVDLQEPGDIEGNPSISIFDRDQINGLESGGRVRYSRDYVRQIAIPTKWAQYSSPLKTLPLVGFRGAPIIVAMDWDNTLEVSGQHIHTMPATFDGSLDFTIQQQYSQTRFNGSAIYRLTEFL
jgi:hypothetical protein